MSLDVSLVKMAPTEMYGRNITHNLAAMADAAGLYQPIWRPDEMTPPVTTAAQLAPLLRDGLATLTADPERFTALNPQNEWGSYAGLVAFVRQYLAACEAHPDATVEVSR